jgi:hypothetical protein
MKKIACFAGVMSIACSIMACGQADPSDGPADEASSSPAAAPAALRRETLGKVFHVSDLRRTVGEAALLDDSAATSCFDTVRDAFGRGAGEDLAFGVYDLADVGDVNERLTSRAAELGLIAAAQIPSTAGGYLAVEEGDLELRVNMDSGSELFVNRARFHKGDDAKRLLSEEEYVSRAFNHVAKAVPSARAQQPYAYKLRRYMNASAQGEGAPTTEAAYQVAVAFNTTVDDLPIIGAGGKVAVHMSPDGEVISHESSVRAVSSLRAVVRGADLLPPDAARGLVEKRVAERGVNLANYTLARSEFGYYRLGRSSVQTIVAPHYAFVYMPKEGTIGKKLLETIPAVVAEDVLEMVNDDRAAEAARKDMLKAGATKEDSIRPE